MNITFEQLNDFLIGSDWSHWDLHGTAHQVPIAHKEAENLPSLSPPLYIQGAETWWKFSSSHALSLWESDTKREVFSWWKVVAAFRPRFSARRDFSVIPAFQPSGDASISSVLVQPHGSQQSASFRYPSNKLSLLKLKTNKQKIFSPACYGSSFTSPQIFRGSMT